MSADILRQRIHDEIGAMPQRTLKYRAEKGIVDRHRRPAAALPRADLL